MVILIYYIQLIEWEDIGELVTKQTLVTRHVVSNLTIVSC